MQTNNILLREIIITRDPRLTQLLRNKNKISLKRRIALFQVKSISAPYLQSPVEEEKKRVRAGNRSDYTLTKPP